MGPTTSSKVLLLFWLSLLFSYTLQRERESILRPNRNLECNLNLFFYSHITRHAQYEHPCAPQYHPLLRQPFDARSPVTAVATASSAEAAYYQPTAAAAASVATAQLLPPAQVLQGASSSSVISMPLQLQAQQQEQLQQAQQQQQQPIVHTQFHQPHVLVPANPYLHEGLLMFSLVTLKAILLSSSHSLQDRC